MELNDDITYEEKIITRHQNLYAIYFPDQNYELVEKTSTAINIFRIIFNHFFNADYDLLEDLLAATNGGEWYDLDDTTHITINNKMN